MNSTPLVPALREDWQRALCVAAHPDDLEYGTAAAVAKWTSQGKQVTYLIATSGEAGIDSMHPDKAGPLRQEEERQAALEVGVEVVEFLDHHDGTIEYGLPLRRDIARAIRRHRPEVIISGGFTVRMIGGVTNQADHRAVGLAALDAARDAGNRWVFTELGEEGLEPWNGVRYVCLAGASEPNHGVDVTGFVDRGIASLQAHHAYLEGLGTSAFNAEEFLPWIAATAGAAMGVEAAVLFDVHTLIFDEQRPWTTDTTPS
jgi:LmbE family N-acetylglucosaminyl deacetylase